METLFISVGFGTLWIYNWMFGKLEYHSLYPKYIYTYIDNNSFEKKQYSWKPKNCIKWICRVFSMK